MQNIGAWRGTYGGIFENVPGVIIFPNYNFVCMAPVFHITMWVHIQVAGCARHYYSGRLSCRFQMSDSSVLALTCLPEVWNMGCSTHGLKPAQFGCASLCTGMHWTRSWSERTCSGLSGMSACRYCSCSGLPDTWKSQINGQVLFFLLESV